MCIISIKSLFNQKSGTQQRFQKCSTQFSLKSRLSVHKHFFFRVTKMYTIKESITALQQAFTNKNKSIINNYQSLKLSIDTVECP